nr:unnamed protein product [Digitaria exilis]
MVKKKDAEGDDVTRGDAGGWRGDARWCEWTFVSGRSVLAATIRPILPTEGPQEPSPSSNLFPIRPEAGRSALLAIAFLLAASPCLQGNAARDPAPPSALLSQPPHFIPCAAPPGIPLPGIPRRSAGRSVRSFPFAGRKRALVVRCRVVPQKIGSGH